jgi:hypothetical protein
LLVRLTYDDGKAVELWDIAIRTIAGTGWSRDLAGDLVGETMLRPLN